MGYRGKLVEQGQCRELRAQGYALHEIARIVGVSKSSVSLWVRDVEFVPRIRTRRYLPGVRRPNVLERAKHAEIERLHTEGAAKIGQLSEKEFLVAGAALYAGEGAKRDGGVVFANSDPRMILFFVTWLRRFFDIDEERLRLRLYLHEGLDLEAANQFWADLTSIPMSQFRRPYRAVADPSIRVSKHPNGCPAVLYSCSRTHRAIMGLVGALLSWDVLSGVAQSAAQRPVKPTVLGSSPSPGATPRS